MRLVKIPYKNAVGNNEEPVGDQVNRQTSLVAEGRRRLQTHKPFGEGKQAILSGELNGMLGSNPNRGTRDLLPKQKKERGIFA